MPKPNEGGNEGNSLDPKEELAKMQAQVDASNASVAERDKQIRALSSKSNAWDKVARDLGDTVQYDEATGLPTNVNWGDDDAGKGGNASSGDASNPFQGVVEDTGKVDAYIANSLKGKYLSPEEAQKMVNSAVVQSAKLMNNHFQTTRTVDKILGQEKYKELNKYDSDLSKRTQAYLKESGLGEGAEGAQSFDSWKYSDQRSLKVAADVASAEIILEAQDKKKNDLEAENNAAGNNFANSQGNAAGSGSGGSQEYKKLIEEGKTEELDDLLKKEVAQNLGVG